MSSEWEREITSELAAALKTARSSGGGQDSLRSDLEFVAALLRDGPSCHSVPALLFRGRDGRVKSCAIGDRLLCGRAAECDVRFSELREISRHHFSIRRDGEEYWLIDKGSFNGTKVRGRLIERHELRDGDIIDAAGLLFAFVKH